MFKLPNSLSDRPAQHEIADFIEWQAWRAYSFSTTALSQVLGRLEENDYSQQGVPEDDENEPLIEEAFVELERRKESCGEGGYPFQFGGSGNVLRFDPGGGNTRHDVYLFLLLATRLRMDTDRDHGGFDGTHLFEEIAALVARRYLGVRAHSMVFGAGRNSGSFRNRVVGLCSRVEEGEGFSQDGNDGTSVEKDGRLDVVAWKPFSDGRVGKLTLFGQCKTGTSYRDSLTSLQPDEFIRKFLKSSFVLTPVRSFFISEALPTNGWRGASIDAGLLFDRCRIVEFSTRIPSGLLKGIGAWTNAARKSLFERL